MELKALEVMRIERTSKNLIILDGIERQLLLESFEEFYAKIILDGIERS